MAACKQEACVRPPWAGEPWHSERAAEEPLLSSGDFRPDPPGARDPLKAFAPKNNVLCHEFPGGASGLGLGLWEEEPCGQWASLGPSVLGQKMLEAQSIYQTLSRPYSGRRIRNDLMRPHGRP